MHRLRRMRALWCETQFYRWAAREEERVSSQIVNETFGLREAYRNAEQINIELAQSHRELERVSRLDGLSGLLNRSSLFATVDAELERTERTGNALCAVMMDIDRFKNINDTFGHACGDAVLRGVGGLLQRELRKYDQAGRYGGEEFLIVLPNTTVIAATAFAERVRRALHLLPIEHGGTTLRVSASFGVARYRVGEGRDRWISRADRALYRAKRSGRNRVEGESDDS
jgi:diguanylate cyclase (GGDEF)-like protein